MRWRDRPQNRNPYLSIYLSVYLCSNRSFSRSVIKRRLIDRDDYFKILCEEFFESNQEASARLIGKYYYTVILAKKLKFLDLIQNHCTENSSHSILKSSSLSISCCVNVFVFSHSRCSFYYFIVILAKTPC
jgi:hypothetical protein